MNLRTDEELGSYTLESKIGKGAAGVVWSATSPTHPEPVAIKILRDDLTDDPEVVARFLQEQQIFDSVDHPNVVKVYDLIVEDRLGIVMELLEDGDLRSLIASDELTVPDAIDIARQVADGLAHIHQVGVLHRDLKPANVLVGGLAGDRAVKISDFGVSKLVGQTTTRTSTTIGTPLYMAPEVTGSRGAGMPSDVYALGAMLYEMLIGSPPFHGDGTLAIILAHSQSPVPELRGIPTELAALVGEMLHKDPNLRPAASEVSSRLTAVVPLLDNSMMPFATSPFEPVDMTASDAEPASGLFDRSVGVFEETENVQAVEEGEGEPHTRLHESHLRTIAVRSELGEESADEPWPAAVDRSNAGPSALTSLVSRRLGTIVVSAAALVALFSLALVVVDDDGSEVVAESDTELAAGPDRANGESISNSPQAGSQRGTTPSEASSSSAVRSGNESAAASDSDLSDETSSNRGSTNAASSGSEATSPAATGKSAAKSAPSKKATTPKKGTATRKGASGENPATTTSTERPRNSSTAVESAAKTDDAATPATTPTTADKSPTSASAPVPTTKAPGKVTTTAKATTEKTTTEKASSEKATTTTTAEVASIVGPPTTKASLVSTTTAAPTTATTAAPIASKQVAIVSGPSVVSVSGTSAIFRYTTNPVCATGSFTYRNQSTGAVVGRWVGDRGCFGPVHDGSTAWPNIVLEPGTTYTVSILLEGQPSDGTLATGTGRATSSIVITTPG